MYTLTAAKTNHLIRPIPILCAHVASKPQFSLPSCAPCHSTRHSTLTSHHNAFHFTSLLSALTGCRYTFSTVNAILTSCLYILYKISLFTHFCSNCHFLFYSKSQVCSPSILSISDFWYTYSTPSSLCTYSHCYCTPHSCVPSIVRLNYQCQLKSPSRRHKSLVPVPLP